MAAKKIHVSVINDLATDQRVSRTCHELHSMGYEVNLIGRLLPSSPAMPAVPYKTKRMKLRVTKGALFYAWYNWRLFWLLLFSKTDLLWSNDLDTLLANYCVSKLRGKPLIFDSHEYFTEVPELENNAFAKKTWKRIEGYIVPRLQFCITVNHSIAGLFREKYNIPFRVIRNVPVKKTTPKTQTRKDLGMPEDKKILILQGSGINMDRGSEELVEAFRFLPEEYHLYIVGSGDVIDILKQMVKEQYIEHKVTFVGKQPYSSLIQYTMNADAGVTLDKNTNINYYYSLPNKLFDYIQCQIPVLSSDLPELKAVIDQYKVGVIVEEVTPQKIAAGVLEIFRSQETYSVLKSNTIPAAEILNWETEKKVLHQLMKDVG